MQRIVDTHVHIWNLQRAEYPWLQNDTSILNKTWEIAALNEEREAAGVTEGVLVQAGGNLEDTELMLETARATTWISGVVGWLPLKNPVETNRLLDTKFLHEKYFKGIRHQVHDEPDAKWLLQPAVLESLAILAEKNIPFDIVAVKPGHIETAIEVAERIPGLKMVFDHLSQPPVAAGEKFGLWGDLMKVAAQHPGFHAKISGLGTTTKNRADWGAKDIAPYMGFILDHFGADRCFCGGDWPVSLLAGGYVHTWAAYKEVLTTLASEKEQEKILYHNACVFYNL
ncbi:MAG: amidohydrolase family protein [Chitinophagaceae bacterium]